MPLASGVKFPARLKHLRLSGSSLSENQLGDFPDNLISLNLDFDDGVEDSQNFGFDTLDITKLPDSLQELAVTMPDPEFSSGGGRKVKLVGTVPKGLRKIILSEEMGIENSIIAAVECFAFER
jgi:hypothetical protein